MDHAIRLECSEKSGNEDENVLVARLSSSICHGLMKTILSVELVTVKNTVRYARKHVGIE